MSYNNSYFVVEKYFSNCYLTVCFSPYSVKWRIENKIVKKSTEKLLKKNINKEFRDKRKVEEREKQENIRMFGWT